MNELVEDILVSGHTLIPYAKYYGEKLLVNARKLESLRLISQMQTI